MKKILLSLMAIAFITVSTSVVNAQDPPKKISVKVTAKNVQASRGTNPNIKGDMPTTDTKAAKSRGTCGVYYYNHTGYYVKIYVDGYYKGTLSPYANGNVFVGDGYTTIYCITAGGTKEWSASGNCQGIYTYDLYE